MSFLPESDSTIIDDIARLWLEATNHPTEWTSPEKSGTSNDYRHTQHHFIFPGEHLVNTARSRPTATHLAEIIDQWVQQKLSNNVDIHRRR